MKILALIVAAVCFVAAGLYASGHFPGEHMRHMKHALIFGGLGILALVWMRMQSASSTTATT